MKEMIYDFSMHSLYYESQNMEIHSFSLAIDTLELVFEIQTGKLLYVQGFFPLIQATKNNINLPVCKKNDYFLHNFDLSTCEKNKVYDLTKKIPNTCRYFERIPTRYDEKRGIIQIGEEMKKNEMTIKVNDNILCGLDNNSDLKCIYILPTRFIGNYK